ncbi:MAG: sigma-70 family RNA polymerase sigma factor [Polyangiaceae bacterium]
MLSAAPAFAVLEGDDSLEPLSSDDVAPISTIALHTEMQTPEEAPQWTLREVVDEYHAFVWRSLRRLGVHERNVDDATQAVFLAVSKHLPNVTFSKMRSFVFGVAMRVAANERRSQVRHSRSSFEIPSDARSDEATPDVQLEQKRARAILDELLNALPDDLRTIFLLCELESMSGPEAAELLGIPVGTATSRLRRARELVEAEVKRLRAREDFQGNQGMRR